MSSAIGDGQIPEEGRDASQSTENLTRQWLLHELREIMEIAMRRVTSPKTSASERIKWSRIAIAAGQACNSVLRDVEIDALKQQINELKQLTLEREEDQDEHKGDQTGNPETPTDD